MKLSTIGTVFVILATLFVIHKQSKAQQLTGNEDFTQCTVTFPDERVKGVCVSDGTKYYRFFTCEGKSLAYIAPGALPRTDGPTCGVNYRGYNP